jgi:hypothetical protein
MSTKKPVTNKFLSIKLGNREVAGRAYRSGVKFRLENKEKVTWIALTHNAIVAMGMIATAIKEEKAMAKAAKRV